MSRSCPSCGSSVADDAAICPTCGEPLGDERPIATSAPAPASAPAAAPGTTAQAPPRRKTRLVCGACGGENDPGATTCAICGEPLFENEPPRPATSPRDGKSFSATRDYILVLIIAVAFAAGIYLIATPEEQTGPPLPPQAEGQGGQGGAEGALPPGHPPMNQPPALTPEQQQMMSDLEKKVQANPGDLDAKLKLANMYYDVERHDQAVPLYRDYLAKNPDNPDARTDMAYSMANSGDLQGAIDELNRVVKSHPKHQNAAYNLAVMYLSTRNRDSTMYWLRKVVEIDSTTRQGQTALEIVREVENPQAGDSTASPH